MSEGLAIIKKGISGFIRENWFKLLLVGIALYVFFQKDLSFQVHFRSPSAPGEELPLEAEGSGKREKMTQRSGKIADSPDGHRDLLDLSSVFNPSRKGNELKTRLEFVGEEEKLAYMKRFARVAMAEQKKFGIPASVILANAMLHSTAGQAAWSATGNNHFAMPCSESWTGESGMYQGKCLRHYENAWTSYRDHSQTLSREWKTSLPFGEHTDYNSWASALAKNLYPGEQSTDKTLIELIEKYRLFELDKMP